MDKSEVKTKSDLMLYVEQEGYPFVEALWERSIERANENKDKETPIKTTNIKRGDGTVETIRTPAGSVPKDPIACYLQQFKMKQWKKRSMEILEQREYEEGKTEGQQEIINVYFDGDEQDGFDEIIQWINMFENPKEKQYLKQRYSHYYDNYDINDGADKTMLNGILSLEVELYRINTLRAKGKTVDITKEEKLRKMLRESLEAQKWTKKQRSAMDDAAQNKFSIWMEKQTKNGKFTPEHHEVPKDEIDMLIDIIPKAVASMFD